MGPLTVPPCDLHTQQGVKVTADDARERFTFFATWFGIRVRACNRLTVLPAMR